MSRLTTMLWVLCLLGLANPAYSAPQRNHSPELMSLLRAIDHVPSATELKALDPDVHRALERVAQDQRLDSYIRRRSISFLSHFPRADVGGFLQSIGLNESQLRVRWMAIYVYVRVWGERAPEKTHSFVARLLRDTEPLVREAVIRALRHCNDNKLEALVEAHSRQERDPRVKAAIRRFRVTRPPCH